MAQKGQRNKKKMKTRRFKHLCQLPVLVGVAAKMDLKVSDPVNPVVQTDDDWWSQRPLTQFDPATGINVDPENLQNYEIQRFVGSGEFYDVFRAYHRPSGQTVALKRLKMRGGAARIDCTREIEVLRKLRHPNIVQHLESFFADNTMFIALEYADAGDLSKMLQHVRKQNQRIAESIAWDITRQICAGLAYMHRNCVMHRDLKPANVLIKKDRTFQLADFGLSRLLSATSDNAQSLVGTPHYMAPERLAECQYSFSADIWSLGCLIYEMIALHPPFFEHNQNLQMLIKKIDRLDYPPPNPKYSVTLRQLIQRCLMLQPQQRPTIRELVNLIPLPSSKTETSTSDTPPQSDTKTIPANNDILMPESSSNSKIKRFYRNIKNTVFHGK